MKKSTVYLFLCLFAVLIIFGCTKAKSPAAPVADPTSVPPQATFTITQTATFVMPTVSYTITMTATCTITETITATFTHTPTITVTSTVTETATMSYVLFDDFEDNNDYPSYPGTTRWTYGSDTAYMISGDSATGGGNYAYAVTGTPGTLYYDSYFAKYCAMIDATTSFDAPDYLNGLDLGTYAGISFTAKYISVVAPASGGIYGIIRAQNPAAEHIIADFTLTSSWQQYYVPVSAFYPVDGTPASTILSNIVFIQFAAQARSDSGLDTQFGELSVDNIRLVRR